tara:strand:- start:4030 stop:4428 length:399 start_codon:yes stop_codon:yes gene_type:complete
MNKFFVPNKIYEERIAICKDCIFYFSPTGTCKDCGCFMKIKARISSMGCSQRKWLKTKEIEVPDDLPPEIIKEVLEIWQHIKTGRAKNKEAKKRMIELYNTIHNTNFSTGTNCGSCLKTCFTGIQSLYEKYK